MAEESMVTEFSEMAYFFDSLIKSRAPWKALSIYFNK